MRQTLSKMHLNKKVQNLLLLLSYKCCPIKPRLTCKDIFFHHLASVGSDKGETCPFFFY